MYSIRLDMHAYLTSTGMVQVAWGPFCLRRLCFGLAVSFPEQSDCLPPCIYEPLLFDFKTAMGVRLLSADRCWRSCRNKLLISGVFDMFRHAHPRFLQAS